MLIAALTYADVSAIAAPVRVRARTALTGHVLRSPQGLSLRGRLTDDQEAPVSGAPVHAHIKGLEPRVVRTGEDGTFELTISAGDISSLADVHGDSLPWRLEFAGGPNFGSVIRTGDLDLKRTPTTLSARSDRTEVTLDDTPVTIEVSIRGGERTVASVPIHLRVADGPELVGDTDEQGRVAFLLRPDSVGAFGRVRIRARFPGNSDFAPSQSETSLLISRATRLTLRAGREGDTRDGRYRFSGRLVDERGPLPGSTVGIVVLSSDGSTVLERCQRTALTDDRGVFLVAVAAREFLGFDGDTVEVQAVFQPASPELQAARSERAVIPVPGPPGVPLSWYFACLAIAAGLVLLAIVVHLRLWLHLRHAWKQRRLRRHVVEVEDGVVQLMPVSPGRPRGRRDWVAGLAVDRDTGLPVKAANVELSCDGRAVDTDAAADGSFALGPLEAGIWTMRITGLGLVPREARLRLPHGGELDRMNVRLVSVRGRMRDVFTGGVRRQTTDVRWGHDTPSEMEQAARASAPTEFAAPLAQLRRLVEDAWFSSSPPALEDVTTAEHLGKELEGVP